MDLDPWTMVLIVGVAAIIGTAICFLGNFLDKRKVEQLSKVADQLSFQFTGDVKARGKVATDRFPLFSIGTPCPHASSLIGRLGGITSRFSQLGKKGGYAFHENVLLRNSICGRSGQVEVTIFDYCYKIRLTFMENLLASNESDNDNDNVHYKYIDQTVICLQNRTLRLPEFELRSNSNRGNVKSVFGNQSVEFGDHPKFSQRFMVLGGSKWAVRRLFSAPIIENFETLDRKISVEGSGNQLIFYRPGHTINPRGIRGFVETCFGVYSLLSKSDAES